MSEEGAYLRVVSLNGGMNFKRRMVEMGIHKNVELIVRQRQGSGIVVTMGETRLALGGGLAHKILVVPVRRNHEASK